jgi:hypothetical protein
MLRPPGYMYHWLEHALDRGRQTGLRPRTEQRCSLAPHTRTYQLVPWSCMNVLAVSQAASMVIRSLKLSHAPWLPLCYREAEDGIAPPLAVLSLM